jgi:hypothetical protein
VKEKLEQRDERASGRRAKERWFPWADMRRSKPERGAGMERALVELTERTEEGSGWCGCDGLLLSMNEEYLWRSAPEVKELGRKEGERG